MAAAEQLDEPLRSDKIPEKEFALLVGTTKRALEGKSMTGRFTIAFGDMRNG